MEELELIYKAFKHCLNEKPEDYPEDYFIDPTEYKLISISDGKFVRDYNVYDRFRNKFCVPIRFYSYMIGLRGFDKFPMFLSNDDYDNLEKRKIYHGFKEFEHGASFLTDWNYHYGTGGAIGTYFSDNKEEALEYARHVSDMTDGAPDKILESKIISSNGIEHLNLLHISDYIKNSRDMNLDELRVSSSVKNKILKFIEFKNQFNQNDKDFQNFMKVFQVPMLGVYLGYDYIYYDSITDNKHFVILNRSAIAVSEKNFYWFTDKSKSYKGDTIVPESDK